MEGPRRRQGLGDSPSQHGSRSSHLHFRRQRRVPTREDYAGKPGTILRVLEAGTAMSEIKGFRESWWYGEMSVQAENYAHGNGILKEVKRNSAVTSQNLDIAVPAVARGEN